MIQSTFRIRLKQEEVEMMNRLRAKALLILMILGVSILNGCGTFPFEGAKFKKVENFPKEKSIIYFYRPKDSGGEQYMFINIENTEIYFSNSVYYPVLVEPGKYGIYTNHDCKSDLYCDFRDTCEFLDLRVLDVKAGQTYYMKIEEDFMTSIYKRTNNLTGVDLVMVSTELAKNEINKTRLLPKRYVSNLGGKANSVCLPDCDLPWGKCMKRFDQSRNCEEVKEACLL